MSSSVRSTFLSLSWGARASDIDTATQQVMAYFSVLSNLGPSFNQWAQLGSSRKTALARPLIDTHMGEEIKRLLLTGQNKTDTRPKVVISELGFSIRVWNTGVNGIEASTSIRCGVNSVYLDSSTQNNILLNIKGHDVVLDEKNVSAVCGDIANIWMPESTCVWYEEDGSKYDLIKI